MEFLAHSSVSIQPSPPSALALWDDLCIYGNELLEAMNELRNGLSLLQVFLVFECEYRFFQIFSIYIYIIFSFCKNRSIIIILI